MTKVRFLIAAVGLSVAMAPVARADDAVRLLAGTGSLSKATSAPTITLKGDSPSGTDTHQVCCWWKRYAYGALVVYAAPAYYPPTYYAPPHATLPPPIAPMSYYYPSGRPLQRSSPSRRVYIRVLGRRSSSVIKDDFLVVQSPSGPALDSRD